MPTIKILAPRSFTDVENSDFNPVEAAQKTVDSFKAHGYEVEIITFDLYGLGGITTRALSEVLTRTMAILMSLGHGKAPSQKLVDEHAQHTARFLALTGNGTLQGTAEKEQG